MKKFYISLLVLVLSVTSFAQGIAVQGIARDNTNAAISDTNLPFTFDITKSDNTVLFSERRTIRTDIFGVFSHIVSTGNPITNTFASVDFSEQNLRLKVSVSYNGSDIEVYNQSFQYTPYAHYARNGAPTGSIMAFMGIEVPDGWLLCDGSNIPSGALYDPLKAVLGDTKVPNLKGRFLKGSGSGGDNDVLATDNFDVVNLKQYQGTTFKRHDHGPGTLATENGGVHAHNDVLIDVGGTGTNGVRVFNQGSSGYSEAFRQDNSTNTGATYRGSNKNAYPIIGNSGSGHSHTVTEGVTGTADGGSSKENRPNSFGVNYIIKL